MQLKIPFLAILVVSSLAACADTSDPTTTEQENVATAAESLKGPSTPKPHKTKHLTGTFPNGPLAQLATPPADGGYPAPGYVYTVPGATPTQLVSKWTIKEYYGSRVRAPGTNPGDTTAYANHPPFLGDIVGESLEHAIAYDDVATYPVIPYSLESVGHFVGLIKGFGVGTATTDFKSSGVLGPDFFDPTSDGPMTITGTGGQLVGLHCSGTWHGDNNPDQSASNTFDLECYRDHDCD
jgi:hypothetical protein